LRKAVGYRTKNPLIQIETMNEPAPNNALNREETIFNAAVQLADPAKRARYLDLACEHDPALRARLERLLEAEPVGDAFFARRLVNPVLRPSAAPGSVVPSPGHLEIEPGSRIGR
jgi:hypothetical protein